MKLTKERFDQQFEGIHRRLDLLATKDDLAGLRFKMVTKIDWPDQTIRLEKHLDAVAQRIIRAINTGFRKLEERLNN